ncbi:hypothetical protein PYW08_015721 [Mythimna loreyi]|uniref:Uncharacterized protein n=1 Tax=Mythimna loreyi TaxID=667449 RepID=A0ACC2QU28_9NEOP|nr:hypothetical protein PYW08_015721 [Mythimna loreyi]
MKSIINIVGIIILMGDTECFIEDTTSIKILKEQKTLLRKLQNFQDPKDEKPLTWNEMLADVLVNRIKIFSFNKVNDNEIIEAESKPSKTTNIIVSAFSQVMLLYKNCIYDRWATKYEEPGVRTYETTTEDNVVNTSEWDAINDDVEIIEPKYHGKQVDAEEEDEAVMKCPEGTVKDEKGNCIKVHSPLMISVPGQCPTGYRRDRLGNCRIVFMF